MGERMKAALVRWSYQRLPDNEVVGKAMSELGWNTWQGTFHVPDRVNVAYNSKSFPLISIPLSRLMHPGQGHAMESESAPQAVRDVWNMYANCIPFSGPWSPALPPGCQLSCRKVRSGLMPLRSGPSL